MRVASRPTIWLVVVVAVVDAVAVSQQGRLRWIPIAIPLDYIMTKLRIYLETTNGWEELNTL